MTSDLDLLRQFVREQSQDAFSEIVRRHLNLVYSAALRQIRSPQLAEEIAQSVFADLARVAATPSSPKILTPWLYAVTRRTAIDVIRKESRRQLREQIAAEMQNMNATENSWTQIEPFLDEAMDSLDEADRAAILLRYFENKNLREVGEQLQISDDAAQKRVSRAVEKLREFFSKKKIAIGAGGLTILISANAVQSAPIGLAATISAAAVLTGTATASSTAIAVTKTIAMTTIQKSIIGAVLIAAAGTGIFEAHQNSKLQNQNQTFRQEQTSLTGQIQQLQSALSDATNQLANLLAENTQLKSNSNKMELLKLRGEVGVLNSQMDAANQVLSAIKHLGYTPAEVREYSPTNFPLNLPTAGLAYMGYSQPEASLETLLWALRKGNQQVIMETLASHQSWGNWQKLVGANSTDGLAKQGASFMKNIGYVDITKKEIISDNEVLFTVFVSPNSGSVNGITRQIAVKKNQDKWQVEDLISDQ